MNMHITMPMRTQPIMNSADFELFIPMDSKEPPVMINAHTQNAKHWSLIRNFRSRELPYIIYLKYKYINLMV